MTFNELYLNLCKLYPKELSCEWDNDGIMCIDDVNKEVKKVLISLDVTMEAIDYAVQNGFDLIVSHHPLVFKPQKSLCPLNYTQSKLISLIKNNIGVMSFHTRLDAADGGVNDELAKLVGLCDVQVDTYDPIGRIGYLKEKIELSTFAENVKAALNSKIVFYNGNKQVNKVYVVGGDGKDLISCALVQGCDTILTGRASYNTAIDACDMGINIVEAGHYFTEQPVCSVLQREIESICNEIKTEVFCSRIFSV